MRDKSNSRLIFNSPTYDVRCFNWLHEYLGNNNNRPTTKSHPPNACRSPLVLVDHPESANDDKDRSFRGRQAAGGEEEMRACQKLKLNRIFSAHDIIGLSGIKSYSMQFARDSEHAMLHYIFGCNSLAIVPCRLFVNNIHLCFFVYFIVAVLNTSTPCAGTHIPVRLIETPKKTNGNL